MSYGKPRPTGRNRLLRACVLGAAALGLPACSDDAGSGQISGPNFERITLSVRVHLLSSDFAPLNTTLTDDEVGVVFARVNEVWQQADITWDIESIVREEALNADGFALVLAGQLPASTQNVESVLPLGRLLSGMWNVFLIQDLGGIAGGFYFPGIPATLSAEIDPFGQRELTGSAARILAHELGHSLGLAHVPCTPEGNLMAAGCDSQDRTRLTATQVQAAQQQARRGRPFGS